MPDVFKLGEDRRGIDRLHKISPAGSDTMAVSLDCARCGAPLPSSS
jgi:hypothetical protein